MSTRSDPRHGLARVLSKLGLASRSEAANWIRDGRVRVNGRLILNSEYPVHQGLDLIRVDECAVDEQTRCYLALNKPRGLVTTTRDEQARDTVYRCLDGADLPWLAPVGRLDKASEGLLLMCNDPQWAARITDPKHAISKTYHVQIDRIPDEDFLRRLIDGVGDDNDILRASEALLLRAGSKHAWLEIVLDEGRNRQIRRLLTALDTRVLRLVRVAIGSLQLGELPKGGWRMLSAAEVERLSTLGDHAIRDQAAS